MGIQNRYRGGTIAATDVQNSNELAIPKKILDGLGADIDIVAPPLQIGLRGFKQGFHFVDLGVHGADDILVYQSIVPKRYRVKVMGEQGGTDQWPAVYPEFRRN